jgi:hypothetical protein
MTREMEKQRDQQGKAERQFGRVDTYAGQMQMEREQAEATRAALAIWRKGGAR